MPLDPRTPVLVGAAQLLQREEDPGRACEPVLLMERAAREAAEDAGAPGLLSRLDGIFVPRGLWRYSNPGGLLRERLGAAGACSGIAPISGTTVQWMLSRLALEVQAGRHDVVLLVGGEAERTKRRARRSGVPLDWTEQTDSEPDTRFGSHDLALGWWEKRYRVRPVQAFSMYENALRAHRGETPAAHRQRIARLWARNAAVAARNPRAWIQDAPTAERIAAPGPDNPMLAYPYTKRMVANMVVDQSAALILCSLETARRSGVPEERLVFPQVGTDAACGAGVPERIAYHDEPVLARAGRRALELADAAPADFEHVDLYSCFPSAVQIAAAELGFDLARELTITGGLTFAGGPFNSYVLHVIATAVERLRAAPGGRAFVSSVGGYMAKHAFGVYGSEPRRGGFAHACLDAEAERFERRVGLEDYTGSVRVESFAVLSGPEGEPDRLLLSCLADDGSRAFGTSADPALLAAIAREELCGRRGRLRGGVVQLD